MCLVNSSIKRKKKKKGCWLTHKIVGIPGGSFLEDTQPDSMPKIPPQNWFSRETVATLSEL